MRAESLGKVEKQRIAKAYENENGAEIANVGDDGGEGDHDCDGGADADAAMRMAQTPPTTTMIAGLDWDDANANADHGVEGARAAELLP